MSLVMAIFCMSKEYVDIDFLDVHLHQLRTAMSVIELSNQSMIERFSIQSHNIMIIAALRLIEVSYEDLMFMNNLEYILSQSKESIDIVTLVSERLEYFQACFDAYEIEYIFEYANSLVLMKNYALVCRLLDNLIVFCVKNAKQGNTIKIILQNNTISWIFLGNNYQPIFKTSTEKIFEVCFSDGNNVAKESDNNGMTKLEVNL